MATVDSRFATHTSPAVADKHTLTCLPLSHRVAPALCWSLPAAIAGLPRPIRYLCEKM